MIQNHKILPLIMHGGRQRRLEIMFELCNDTLPLFLEKLLFFFDSKMAFFVGFDRTGWCQNKTLENHEIVNHTINVCFDITCSSALTDSVRRMCLESPRCVLRFISTSKDIHDNWRRYRLYHVSFEHQKKAKSTPLQPHKEKQQEQNHICYIIFW